MKRVHYCWWVCLGCALLLLCTSGLSINAFTVYQPYILRENGFTNVQSSSIIAVRSLFSFLAMFLTEAYYKKLSLRAGMGLSGLLTALGFALYALADSHLVYCIGSAAVGFGYGFGTMIPISIVLEHWFVRKRSFAIGLCSAVTGLSTFGIPSAITWMIESWGLKAAFLAEGMCIAAIVLLSFLLLRNEPAEKGLRAYGADETAPEAEREAGSESLRGKHWLLLVPMLLLLGAMTNVGYSHLAVLISSEGFSPQLTALAITVSGLSLTGSKCVYGWVADKIGAYRSNRIFGSVLLLGMLLCCVMKGSSLLLFAAMGCYGAGLATTTVGLTAWAGDLSSAEHYDRTVRRFQLGYAGGTLLFSSLPGYLADRLGGSYIPAYIFFTCCTVYVILSVQAVYRDLNKAVYRE